MYRSLKDINAQKSIADWSESNVYHGQPQSSPQKLRPQEPTSFQVTFDFEQESQKHKQLFLGLQNLPQIQQQAQTTFE
jgi:hypothetical protein